MYDLDYDYIADLVCKTKQGDSDAFAELYVATYQNIYSFAFQYTKDFYLAQDILQEVYIIALKNITALKNPRLFVSWLNQINFRVCFDTFKKHKTESESTMAPEDCFAMATADSTPEDEILKGIQHEEMQKYIFSLPVREAQAIILKYYNDMTLEEISQAMDMSKSSVKRYLQRGKRNLKNLLAGKGGRRVSPNEQ